METVNFSELVFCSLGARCGGAGRAADDGNHHCAAVLFLYRSLRGGIPGGGCAAVFPGGAAGADCGRENLSAGQQRILGAAVGTSGTAAGPVRGLYAGAAEPAAVHRSQ